MEEKSIHTNSTTMCGGSYPRQAEMQSEYASNVNTFVPTQPLNNHPLAIEFHFDRKICSKLSR